MIQDSRLKMQFTNYKLQTISGAWPTLLVNKLQTRPEKEYKKFSSCVLFFGICLEIVN
jgi:hypothetical protein